MLILFLEVGETERGAGLGEEDDKSIWGYVKLVLPVGHWNGDIK